jgi:hypothetical protein
MVAGYYVHAKHAAVGVVRTVRPREQRRVLGVRYGIIKLYPTSKGPLDMIEWNTPTSLFVLARISKLKARTKIQ